MEHNMHVKILGSGCTNCKNLERKVINLLAEHGIDAEVTKVSEIADIMAYGIMRTPGLVIDEVVKSAGVIPKDEQILSWLREARG
jgi:small redox-active disulfide protein 2